MLTRQQMDELQKTFDDEGYLVLRDVVPAPRMARLRDAIAEEFARVKRSGELASIGGMVSGHLNCFPGEQSRFVYETLGDYGVLDLLHEMWPAPLRHPNIGCNVNLPGSNPQNLHIDGYAATDFVIVNVAVVDTTRDNGATELVPRSHKRQYKYWQLIASGLPSVYPDLRAGDVMIRPSTLWHRGQPNRSKQMRPMLGFTWENGGSELDDPYDLHDGQIRFLQNRYGTDLAGRLRERAFAAAPRLGSGYLFVRSMLRG